MTPKGETSKTPDMLRDALDHIMRVAREGITPTRRLDWIEIRARYALEGKQWSGDIRETPRDSVRELVRKNEKFREKNDALERRLHAEREANGRLRELLTDIRIFIATVNHALMMIDGDNTQATAILDQIDRAIERRAALAENMGQDVTGSSSPARDSVERVAQRSGISPSQDGSDAAQVPAPEGER